MQNSYPQRIRARFYKRKEKAEILYQQVEQLILFKPKPDSILGRIADLSKREVASAGELSFELCRLIELAAEWNFSGDLWNCYLTYFLLTDENAFTLSRERKRYEDDALSRVARRDVGIIRGLFGYDLASLCKKCGLDGVDSLHNFNISSACDKRSDAGEILVKATERLSRAESADEFYDMLTEIYSSLGVGEMGFYRAFRIDTSSGKAEIKPIVSADPARFCDIIGYDSQKSELLKNTRAFLTGKAANNVLLYGDGGSGKSTSIKALINECWEDGLRLIEAYKYQMSYLPDVIAKIKGRGYKFILYIDDLSFEEFEAEYKFLKSVIEGDVEGKPENLLVYATSNRRNLIRETWRDRGDMEHNNDVHHSDTLEEKLSLASRFGLSINFSTPSRQQYHDIVAALAKKNGVVMEEEELFKKADAWEIRRGGMSGRAAQQFINYMIGSGVESQGQKE